MSESSEPFGIYIHVPYCRYVCPYCDFNVVAARQPQWGALTRALIAEIDARVELFSGAVRSVYFGGGTPSLAPAEFFGTLLEHIETRFGLPSDLEITAEINPGTVNRAALLQLRDAGVNRASLGWQSTRPHLLRTLGRDHSASQSIALVAAARQAGFGNISCDLIFAVPGQTHADLEADLDVLMHSAPEHVSLYAMTFHAGTPFWRRLQSGKLVALAEDDEVLMMDRIDARLRAGGYEHYEVSSFARPRMQAVHNSGYWQGVPYLGVGPGAESFLRQGWQRGWRWASIREPARYVAYWTDAASPPATVPPQPGVGDAPRAGISDVRWSTKAAPALDPRTVAWWEELSGEQLLRERMMLGLRTRNGVALDVPPVVDWLDSLQEPIALAEARGWVVQDARVLRPTWQGMRCADAVAELFF